jgi:hypothetical protein
MHLPFDLDKSVQLEIPSYDQPLFSYVLRFVSARIKPARSIRACFPLHIADEEALMMPGKGFGKGGNKKRKDEVKMPTAIIGLGWHSFTFSYKEAEVPIIALLQRTGLPVGTGRGPDFFSSLVLFVEGCDQDPLLKLCHQATQEATEQKENQVSLWRYDTQNGFWMQMSRRWARNVDSIVLEESMRQPVMSDLDWFVKAETRAFYASHGIPYHRCYLFHGPPGTGKTSFIYALAGHLERNLCFLQMDRRMTDDTFRKAMSQLPPSAMVVLEDVDALFTSHREADYNFSSLSFSGFLNSLDGLGAPDDVVIFMTSNHPERLDPAVMRPGRIDMKVEFKPPDQDVAISYFLTFYPDAKSAAVTFGAAIGEGMAQRKISMAQLQHFFLACHRMQMGPDRAAEYIKEFMAEEMGSVPLFTCLQHTSRL